MTRVRAYRRPKPGEPENAAGRARSMCLRDESSIAMCGELSVSISHMLTEKRIGHYIVQGYFLATDESMRLIEFPDDFDPDWDAEGHNWIEFEDGSILDASADQFGEFPAVWYPADPNRYLSESKYKNIEAFKAGESEDL